MRKVALTGLLVFAFACVYSGLAAQTLTLNYFNASPDGSDVVVAWEVPDEAGIQQFKIYRKIEEEGSFRYLETIRPDGGLSYQYNDYTLYKESPRNITYRLQIYRNGMVYSYITNILHNPTSVQSTWGKIKAMFR